MIKQGITFFTAIKNRKEHLQQTLPANMFNNRRPDSYFIVLDYGSSDGLEHWINKCFVDELKTGKLIYKRIEASYFDRCDSRNKASKFCQTNLIANIDADNFTGPDFDEWLITRLSENDNLVITGLGNNAGARDAFGKVALHKSLFDRVNGYDCNFDGYGFEDYDLYYRLIAAGAKMVVLQDEIYLNAISHSDEDRIAEQRPNQLLNEIYFQAIGPDRFVLLYLFTDQSFSYGMVTQSINQAGAKYSNTVAIDSWSFNLVSNEWKTGTWKSDKTKLILQFQEFVAEFIFNTNRTQLTDLSHSLVAINDKKVRTEYIMFYMQIKNRYKLEVNLKTLMETNLESAY